MKKILLSACLIAVLISGCSRRAKEDVMIAGPEPVYYSDWDRAIRVDVDMQNMYIDAPQKIEKPIDIYMAMALALKYNYSRRLAGYEQSVINAGKAPVSKLPDIMADAGYSNQSLNPHINPDMKVAWNILDISGIYYQSVDSEYRAGVAAERSRKVIHNILQETRSLYWLTLASQKLTPVIDDMAEYMTLEVDEMNAKAKALRKKGGSLSTEELLKKRQYMEAIQKVMALKRKMETAETRLAGLMGFHPNTQYKLVGKEYGNFALPEMKNELSQLEWLALTNRPELRVYDLYTNVEELQIAVKTFRPEDKSRYKNDPNYYNRLWSKEAKEIGMTILEDVSNPKISELDSLRRQRMTNLVLNQVYVAWARYTSAVEDYQINMEIANTSEDIAEDITLKDGSLAEKSQLEAARAVEDEIKAFQAYAEVQDALGNLYATIGLDAVPASLLNNKPSKIAVALRNMMEKWRKGAFIPDNRPQTIEIPEKRPAINLSGEWLPDRTFETGQRIRIKVPESAFAKMELKGDFTTRAGLSNGEPLPKWLNYDPATYTFDGVAMPSAQGTYTIRIHISDKDGRVGYLEFKLIIIEVFEESLRIRGLTEGSRATVLKRCVGAHCKDNYVDESELGRDVEVRAYH